MNIENIKSDIELLGKITGRWTEEISEMERDIVISLLQRLYTEIKYCDTAMPEIASVHSDAKTERTAQKVEPHEESQLAVQQQAATQPVADNAEPPQTETIEIEEPRTAAEEQSDEHKDMPDNQTTPTEHEEATASEKASETAAEPIVQDAEPQTEEPVIKRPINRSVIRSLYGEPIKNTAKPQQMPASEKPNISEQTPASNTSQAAAQTKVLGEVINQGPTLGDALQGTAGRDMAEKIASADTTTLRGAIGLNDRFMMIRDLFGGDAAAFDAAVSALERFTSLEEALLYINDTYDWNPQSRAAEMLVELLVRKLS